MAKVVVIKGNPNAGKTTATRYVLETLLLGGGVLKNFTKLAKNPMKGDFESVVEIGGKTIAICSRGDLLKCVEGNIQKYINCDVIVVTSRNFSTFGKAINNVYHPEVFSKFITGANLAVNYMDLADFVRQVVAEVLKH